MVHRFWSGGWVGCIGRNGPHRIDRPRPDFYCCSAPVINGKLIDRKWAEPSISLWIGHGAVLLYFRDFTPGFEDVSTSNRTTNRIFGAYFKLSAMKFCFFPAVVRRYDSLTRFPLHFMWGKAVALKKASLWRLLYFQEHFNNKNGLSLGHIFLLK